MAMSLGWSLGPVWYHPTMCSRAAIEGEGWREGRRGVIEGGGGGEGEEGGGWREGRGGKGDKGKRRKEG